MSTHVKIPHRGLLAIAAMTATTMQAIDGTIANVALPHMQASLSATPEQIAWVLTSYIVASAVMIPLTGFLAVRFGRKRMLLLSVSVFTLASVLCGAAQSLEQMVLFRTIQGLGGAALVPLTQAMMLDMYTERERGAAMAMWGIGVMIGPMLGPILGGYLTDEIGWRWIFYINVPFGIFSFIGLALYGFETPLDKVRKFARYGFAMLALSAIAVQLMMDRGQHADWFQSDEIVLLAVLGTVCTLLFIIHLVFSKNPFVDVRMFRDRNFVLGTTFFFAAASMMMASMALTPIMLQSLMNYPVLTTGLIVAPRGLGTMIGMMVVGRLALRIRQQVFIGLGLCITAWSLYAMSNFNLYTGPQEIAWIGFVQGLGIGLIFVCVNLITFETLPARLRNEASAISNAIRSYGASIGISILFAGLFRTGQANHARLTEHITPFNELLQSPAMPGIWDLGTEAGRAAMNLEVTRQAQMMAFTTDFQWMFIATLVILPLVFLVRQRPLGTD